MYILGFPTDDLKSIKTTIDYAKFLNTTYAQFSIFTPYPGTSSYKEFDNKIDVERFESFDQYQLVYKHKNLSKKNVREYLNNAYKSYYSRPSWLFKYLYNYFLI